MRVLIFNRHYLPGYKAGGPIVSISNIIEALGDDIDFSVVTLDRDLLDENPYSDISPEWIPLGKARVLYLKASDISAERIVSIADEVKPDKVYLNSFFDPIFTMRVLRNRKRIGAPIILAPRGEFSPGALARKRPKKEAYILLSNAVGLTKDVVWHASTPHEAADIRKKMRSPEIAVAPDLGAEPAGSTWLPRLEGEPLRVCFLSRISPKKNLDGALRYLRDVRSPVDFRIYGPIEDADYWQRCEDIVKTLPEHISVRHLGDVPRENVPATLGESDLFFFPTFGENYGHVIPEALSVGTPVLTSDQTPWLDLERSGVGWALSLSGDFAAQIDVVSNWSRQKERQVREKCIEYARDALLNEGNLTLNRHLFAR